MQFGARESEEGMGRKKLKPGSRRLVRFLSASNPSNGGK